ncbi:MAG: cytochrome c oxidase assembly protein [Ardenticatenia bacterium]|nr:cytochrome c oxidase assembly protein [Ardenticatenia bacterium]
MWKDVGMGTWGIVLLILVTTWAYGSGWWYVRSRRRGHRLARVWRLGAFLAAVGSLLLAFLPPMTTYEERSFFVHMVQHEVFIEVAPSFFWLAHPVPFLLWGLPVRWRRWITARLLAPDRRRTWHAFSAPKVIVPLYLTTVTLWHVPAAYDAALVWPPLHAAEHLSLLITATAFWWLVTGAAPRLHPRAGYRLPIVYVVAAYVHNEVLGVGLTLIRHPIYTFYERVVPPWNLSPVTDQSLGGAVMWIPGEFIYAATLMALLMRLLEEKEPYRGTYESYPLPSQAADPPDLGRRL